MASKRSVIIRLEEESPRVDHLVKVLLGTQDALYAIGRYLTKTSPQGRLAERVKGECSLVIKKISMHSPLEAEVAIAPTVSQTCFDGGELVTSEDLGEPSMDLFEEIVDALQSPPAKSHERIHQLVDSREHRLDIARSFIKMIPENASINLKFPRDSRGFTLDQNRRSTAYSIAAKEEVELVSVTKNVRNIRGPVIEARIVEDMHFMINDLVCKFDEKDVPRVRGLLGRVISLSGKAKVQNNRILEISKILDINQIDEWQFSELISDDLKMRLTQPLVAAVAFEEGSVWISDSANIGIVGVGKTWEEAIDDFSASFLTKLVGYAGESDKALTGDAVEVRDKIRRLVPDWKEVLKHAQA
jgi:hypothetical protein